MDYIIDSNLMRENNYKKSCQPSRVSYTSLAKIIIVSDNIHHRHRSYQAAK